MKGINKILQSNDMRVGIYCYEYISFKDMINIYEKVITMTILIPDTLKQQLREEIYGKEEP